MTIWFHRLPINEWFATSPPAIFCKVVVRVASTLRVVIPWTCKSTHGECMCTPKRMPKSCAMHMHFWKWHMCPNIRVLLHALPMCTHLHRTTARHWLPTPILGDQQEHDQQLVSQHLQLHTTCRHETNNILVTVPGALWTQTRYIYYSISAKA